MLLHPLSREVPMRPKGERYGNEHWDKASVVRLPGKWRWSLISADERRERWCIFVHRDLRRRLCYPPALHERGGRQLPPRRDFQIGTNELS